MRDRRLSAYLVTDDPLAAGWPLDLVLDGLLSFADELVVLDAGSEDGTGDTVQARMRDDRRVRALRVPVPADDPRRIERLAFELPSLAREACRGAFVFAGAVDELVDPADADAFRTAARTLAEGAPTLAIPVLEYWGGPRRVRRDVPVSATRLSRHLPNLYHGVPAGGDAGTTAMRRSRALGDPAAALVDAIDGRSVPARESLPTPALDRLHALQRGVLDADAYEKALTVALFGQPVVHRIRWLDVDRGLAALRARAGAAMADAHPYFDTSWARVDDAMLATRAALLRVGGPRLLGGPANALVTSPRRLPLPPDRGGVPDDGKAFRAPDRQRAAPVR